jgi:hypothetical protein
MFRVIVSIAFTYLNFHEMLTLGERISEILRRAFSSNEFMVDQLAKLQAACDKLMKAFQRTMGSAYTEQLAALDRARDDAFSSLTGFFDGMVKMKSKPQIVKAAKELLAIIEKHDRGLYRFGYARESAALYALEKELSEEGPTQLLAALGATELFEELKVSSKAFEGTYQSKIAEKGVKDYPVAAAAARDVIYRLNCLLTVADVFANDDPQTYTKCAGELNETITGIMTPARSRKTAQENVAAAALEKEKELTTA